MADNTNVTRNEEKKVDMYVDTTMYDDISLVEHFAASTGLAFYNTEREFEAKTVVKNEAKEAKKAVAFRTVSNEEAVMEALDEARRDGPGKDFVR